MCPCPEWAERRGKWKSLCRKEGQGPGARQAGDKGHGFPGPPVSSIQVPPGSKEDPRLQAAGWGPGQGPQAGPGVRLRPLQRCWWNPKLWNTHTRTCRHTHAHTCMHTHTETHACTHAGIHIYACTQSHMYTEAYTCTLTHVRMHTHRHTHTFRHTDVHVCTHVHVGTHVHAGTCTHACTHIHMQAHTPTPTHMHTHTGICIHPHAHTHTCTHTYAGTHTHLAASSPANCVAGSSGTLLTSGSSLPCLPWHHVTPGGLSWTSGPTRLHTVFNVVTPLLTPLLLRVWHWAAPGPLQLRLCCL